MRSTTHYARSDTPFLVRRFLHFGVCCFMNSKLRRRLRASQINVTHHDRSLFTTTIIYPCSCILNPPPPQISHRTRHVGVNIATGPKTPARLALTTADTKSGRYNGRYAFSYLVCIESHLSPFSFLPPHSIRRKDPISDNSLKTAYARSLEH